VVYARQFRRVVEDVTDVEIVVAPPALAVHAVAEALRSSNVGVAAQDLYWAPEGAFTGEISAPMIREAGAEYVIVGHSERRTLFGETDAMVNLKARAALAADLTPIVCIGEKLDEREEGRTFAVLDAQIRTGLENLTPQQVSTLVIAYEPVWAIGTGRHATPAQATEAHRHIRQRLQEAFGTEAAERCHIVYGGSVKPSNIRELLAAGEVDGALVGGASLEVESFAEVVARSRPATV
jgi:triosephosphate isomerase